MGSLGKQLRMAFFHHLDIVRSQGPLREPTLGPSWAPAAVWRPELGPCQRRRYFADNSATWCPVARLQGPPTPRRPKPPPHAGCPRPAASPTPLPQAVDSSGSPPTAAGTESPRPRGGP